MTLDPIPSQIMIGKLVQAANAFLVSGFGTSEDRLAAREGLIMYKEMSRVK